MKLKELQELLKNSEFTGEEDVVVVANAEKFSLEKGNLHHLEKIEHAPVLKLEIESTGSLLFYI